MSTKGSGHFHFLDLSRFSLPSLPGFKFPDLPSFRLPGLSSVKVPKQSSFQMFSTQPPSTFGWITYPMKSVFTILFTPALEIVSAVQCAIHKRYSCLCSSSRFFHSPTSTTLPTLLIATILVILALLYALIILARHGYADRIIYRKWQPSVLKRTSPQPVKVARPRGFSGSSSEGKKLAANFRNFFGMGDQDGGRRGESKWAAVRPESSQAAWGAERKERKEK